MSPREPVRGEAPLAFVAYLLLALWWLWPLPASAVDHMLYFLRATLNHADVDLEVWSMAWGAHALLSDPVGIFDANSFYPSPLPLAYSEHFLGHLPLFAPTYWLTGNPVLAANGVILLLHGLSGLGLYLLARRFVSAPAAFFGGFVFTFYPTRLEHLGHYHMLATGYLPLAMFFTERWLEAAKARHAVGIGLAIGLQLLCSFYLAYAAALAYGLYLVLALGRVRASLDRRRVTGLALALGCAALPFLASAIPYLTLRQWGLIPDYAASGGEPPGLEPSMTRSHVAEHLMGRGLGLAGSLLAIVALVPPWRGGSWPRILALSIGMLGLLLGFGPWIAIEGERIPSPYLLLQEWMPGFSAIRSSRRFLVVAQLGMSLLAALGLQRLLASRRAPTAWVASAVAIVLAYASFPSLPEVSLYERPVGDSVPRAYRWLEAHGKGRPLLEFPTGNQVVLARRMYLSHAHWLPHLQGYSAYAPWASRYLQRLAASLPSKKALEELTDTVDVGWILVHLDELGSRAQAWEGDLPPGIRKARRFGDDLIVKVNRRPVKDPAARLFDPEHTMGGVPLEAVGPDCPGRIVLEKEVPPVVPSGERLNLWLRIENHGDRAWPGLAFLPPHAVHLIACVAVRGGECTSLGVPLWADVLPQRSVRTATMMRAPPFPGDFEIQLRLGQPADGVLDDCGVAPLIVPIRVALALPGGPPGTYRHSCEQCTWDGHRLACRCMDGDGRWNETAATDCEGGYGNREGRLVCEES